MPSAEHASHPPERHPRQRSTNRCCLVATAIVALGVSACAHPRPVVPDQFVSLHNHSLRLHLDNAGSATRPLLVYATGDGGMHRKDLDTYRHLAALGNPIVGFDARDYVKHLGTDSGTTTPEKLADDYSKIIERARQTLGIDAAREVVLVGVSRGAGLAVVAAGQLREKIAGIVAVALTQEEEYVRWFRRVPISREGRKAVMVDVYEYLAQLGDIPIAVIQSTHDRYLPAAQARQRFGPDTAYRWLQPIEAANHNFGGARPELYSAIAAALKWIARQRTDQPSPQRSLTADAVTNVGSSTGTATASGRRP